MTLATELVLLFRSPPKLSDSLFFRTLVGIPLPPLPLGRARAAAEPLLVLGEERTRDEAVSVEPDPLVGDAFCESNTPNSDAGVGLGSFEDVPVVLATSRLYLRVLLLNAGLVTVLVRL